MNKHTNGDQEFSSRYWECIECGAPSTEYTDHVICLNCARGETVMSDDVVFKFYSDTNQSNAFDELQLLSLDICEQVDFDIHIGASDFNSMEDDISVIVSNYGGEESF